MRFAARIYLQRSGDYLFVQSGRDVFKLNVANGTKSRLFRMPEHEILMASFGSDFLAAVDDRFDRNNMRIIGSDGISTAWESNSIESIVEVTPSAVVAVTAGRKYDDGKKKSYHLENAYLRSFDRKNGNIRWSMPLASAGVGSTPALQVHNFVAVVDRLASYDPSVGDSQLVVLQADTGAVLSKRIGRFVDLWPFEGSLGVLERARTGADEAEFYVCQLPECEQTNPVSLSAKEILKVRLYKDYIITAGIYDAACFERTTGKRLWEKGQLEWSEPFDDQMIVTKFSRRDQSARIVSVDLQTGQEQVLFSRKVTPRDRASVKPW
jgi:hypothetical protein